MKKVVQALISTILMRQSYQTHNLTRLLHNRRFSLFNRKNQHKELHHRK